VPGVKGGVAATSEPIAAQIGGNILRQGGNAVDAACAIAFALNVLEPQSSGIGGGGFMMIHIKKWKKTFVVDSRERAPAAASPDMFLDKDGNPFSFGIRSTSGIGVGVPGMVKGIAKALDKWGTISFADALQPAIKLAEEGFRVSSRLESSIADGLDSGGRLANEIGDPAYDEARLVFTLGGVPLVQNQLLVQPDLAETFKLLADEGPDAFYTGPLAQAIIDTQLSARSVPDGVNQLRLKGRMSLDDLEQYEVAIRKPVEGYYRGLRIVSMPPPSSGGLTVIQILKLIERFPIGDASQGYGFGSTRTLNVMMEAMRLAFADRAVWMGDDDFVDVPSAGLLNDDYIAMRSALIDPDSRQDEVFADDPRPFDMASVSPKIKIAMAKLPDEEGLNTTHFTVIDRHGNIVTYTNTIESAWGTGLMVPEYGFLLNNELTDFNRVPAANPDLNNFNPGANDAAPFKRPRSSMSPNFVFRGKKPIAAYGSPGGSTIINSVVNVTMNLIDHKRNIQEAVDAPRISQTSANGSPNWEAGFDQAVIDELKASPFGHNLADSRLSVIGSVQAVVIGPVGKVQYGAADRRRIGGIVSVRRSEITRP
jgi:gamma-glutamyltranspeptidase/glutathione hydrolase